MKKYRAVIDTNVLHAGLYSVGFAAKPEQHLVMQIVGCRYSAIGALGTAISG